MSVHCCHGSGVTFPGIFLTPIAGIAADHWGRKTVLVPSLFLVAFAGFSLFYAAALSAVFGLVILFTVVREKKTIAD